MVKSDMLTNQMSCPMGGYVYLCAVWTFLCALCVKSQRKELGIPIFHLLKYVKLQIMTIRNSKVL